MWIPTYFCSTYHLEVFYCLHMRRTNSYPKLHPFLRSSSTDPDRRASTLRGSMPLHTVVRQKMQCRNRSSRLNRTLIFHDIVLYCLWPTHRQHCSCICYVGSCASAPQVKPMQLIIPGIHYYSWLESVQITGTYHLPPVSLNGLFNFRFTRLQRDWVRSEASPLTWSRDITGQTLLGSLI